MRPQRSLAVKDALGRAKIPFEILKYYCPYKGPSLRGVIPSIGADGTDLNSFAYLRLN